MDARYRYIGVAVLNNLALGSRPLSCCNRSGVAIHDEFFELPSLHSLEILTFVEDFSKALLRNTFNSN